jgi:RNA polymerase sigma factor (sigma-70 family)
MDDAEWLARRFDENRAHLRTVAYRILGSQSDAEDAVQESWLRLSRSDAGAVENLGGWLTTVVARIALNMLRSRTARREEPQGTHLPDELAGPSVSARPEDEALLAESVGPALLVVLDALEPAERVAFVLHDVFAVPFAEIAPVVGRSVEATRQLASRARRRVQGADGSVPGDQVLERQIVGAFLAASRSGSFDALMALLDPDVALRADDATVRMGADLEVLGAPAVARTFAGRAQAARLALVDGVPGAVWFVGGQPRVVFRFHVTEARIRAIDMVSDPATLQDFELEMLPA